MILAPQGRVAMSDPDLGISFTKHAAFDPDGCYPLGCNTAVYVAPGNLMVELETMAIVTVPPGRELRHVERWSLAGPTRWR